MRIGIDAHSIGSGAGGNETYYELLLRWLARTPAPENTYVVYFTYAVNGIWQHLNKTRFKLKQIRPATPFLRIPLRFPVEFRREKLDLFHAQYIVPPFCNCRTVVSIFDITYEHYPEFFSPFETARSRLLIRQSARRADHILTLSQYSARDIARIYHVDPEKVTVTYLAAREDFHPMDKSSCKEEIARKYGISSPFILYIGRLQARKNLVRLVEAYARLCRQGVLEKLVIVGKKDWLFNEVLARVQELRLESEVVFTGYAPREDLPVFYNAAELFVFPSIFEGFGLPVIEAMACGVPVVTSVGSSLEEVSGDAALLVDPFHVQSISDAIAKVLGDPCLKTELQKKGLRRSAEFSFERAVSQTLEVYKRVAGA